MLSMLTGPPTRPAHHSNRPHARPPARPQVVLKSQILAGGRGLGKFKSGLQGGVHICSKEKAVELSKQMLGGILITKQTGPAGKPVNTLYVAKKMKFAREMYFAILLDRATAGPVMIGSSEVGFRVCHRATAGPLGTSEVGHILLHPHDMSVHNCAHNTWGGAHALTPTPYMTCQYTHNTWGGAHALALHPT